MTDTIQRTTPESDDFTEKTEADLTPGDLCWVTTGDDAPTTVRNSRVMAVYTQGVGSNRWLLLVPNGDHPAHGTHGWVLRNNLIDREMDRMNVTRFADTHRGWWAGHRVQFIETCSGHWCVTHQAFHATPDCPPLDPWAAMEARAAARAGESEVDRLRRELAEARAEVEKTRVQGEQNLEAFRVRLSDILGSEADSHDLCGEYDRIAEEAGLYRRTREHEVVIEVTYRQTLRIEARSPGQADEEVRYANLLNGWHPDLAIDIDPNETSTPTDVAFKVIVEPPF